MADLVRFQVFLEDCPSVSTFEIGSNYSFVSVNILDNLVPNWKIYPSSTFKLPSSVSETNPWLDIIDTKDFKVKVGSVENCIPLTILGHGNDIILGLDNLWKFISTISFCPPNCLQIKPKQNS